MIKKECHDKEWETALLGTRALQFTHKHRFTDGSVNNALCDQTLINPCEWILNKNSQLHKIPHNHINATITNTFSVKAYLFIECKKVKIQNVLFSCKGYNLGELIMIL